MSNVKYSVVCLNSIVIMSKRVVYWLFFAHLDIRRLFQDQTFTTVVIRRQSAKTTLHIHI